MIDDKMENFAGSIIIHCDGGCGATYVGWPDQDFRALWKEARGEGWHAWKSWQTKHRWRHHCPQCGAR